MLPLYELYELCLSPEINACGEEPDSSAFATAVLISGLESLSLSGPCTTCSALVSFCADKREACFTRLLRKQYQSLTLQ